MSDDCIFCKIANGEMGTELIASNDEAVVFADLEPQAPVHMLAIPRRHIENADALGGADAETLNGVFAAARRAAANKGLSPRNGDNGYRLVFNVGDDANNTVGHLHLHILGGRKMTWPPG